MQKPMMGVSRFKFTVRERKGYITRLKAVTAVDQLIACSFLSTEQVTIRSPMPADEDTFFTNTSRIVIMKQHSKCVRLQF
jgi:hypothetical protein